MLLDAPFCPLRESLVQATVSTPSLERGSLLGGLAARSYLCDFAPTVSGISHLLQPLLLGGRPRSIRSALLGLWLWDGSVGLWDRGRCSAVGRASRC